MNSVESTEHLFGRGKEGDSWLLYGCKMKRNRQAGKLKAVGVHSVVVIVVVVRCQ